MKGLTKELMTLRPARKLPRGISLMTRGLERLVVVTRLKRIWGLTQLERACSGCVEHRQKRLQIRCLGCLSCPHSYQGETRWQSQE